MLRNFRLTVRCFGTNNYYKLLGVRENSEFNEIKKSYIEKLKTSHPDLEEGSHHKFIELQKAFQTLIDPVKRKEHDKSIGINNPTWVFQEFYTNPNFENEQIEAILTGKSQKRTKFKSPYENLNIRFREQQHKKQSTKYFYMTLLVHLSAFCVFWTMWQTVEKFILKYKGNATYIEKISKEGKDLSIVVTQIR